MTTDNTVYFRLSGQVYRGRSIHNVKLENMDGSKVAPILQREIAKMLNRQAQLREYVYIAESYNPEQSGYKVGKTKDIERRERELDVDIIFNIECDTWGNASGLVLEKLLHELYTFAGLRILGEWFDLTWWDIELLRIFFKSYPYGDAMDEKVDQIMAFKKAVDGLQPIYHLDDVINTKSALKRYLGLWDKTYQLHEQICIVYLVRRLVSSGCIPETIFRFAAENIIFRN
jgi:hypothetical protein